MTDYLEYVKFPFQDHDWPKKLLIGAIIIVIPVVNILALGYLMECMRLGIRGRTVLPEWREWEQLAIQGLMLLVVGVVYLIIPGIFTVVLGGVPILGIMLTSVITLIMSAIVPMAAANYVMSNNLLDAFRFAEILYYIKKVMDYYAPAYLLMALVTAVASAFTVGLPIFSFIGIIVIFYSGIVFSHYMGQLYSEAVN